MDFRVRLVVTCQLVFNSYLIQLSTLDASCDHGSIRIWGCWFETLVKPITNSCGLRYEEYKAKSKWVVVVMIILSDAHLLDLGFCFEKKEEVPTLALHLFWGRASHLITKVKHAPVSGK